MSNPSIHVEEDSQLSVPRGGPIFLSDMVGRLTRVYEFETAAVEELEKLKAELLCDFSEASEEDISVNELKIISEEELVKKAFEEAFQDDEEISNSSEVVEEQSHTGRKQDGGSPLMGENVCVEDTSPPGTSNNGESDRNHDGRMPICENVNLDDSRSLGNTLVSHEPFNGSPQGTCNIEESDRSHDGGGPICEIASLEASGALENALVSDEVLDTSLRGTCDNGEPNIIHDGKTPICENACLEGSGPLENAPSGHEPVDTSPPGTCNNRKSARQILMKRKVGHDSKQKKPTSSPGTCNNVDSDENIRTKRKRRHTGKQKEPTSPPGACTTGESDGKIMRKKRGRTGKQKKPTKKENYIAKVERIVEIKKKQDEERKAARLHSLETNKSANPPADTTERLQVLKSMSSKMKVKLSNSDEYVPVRHPEVVLCVEVYHNKRTWAKSQEFWVLGCQLLTELKDRITCLTDELMSKSDVHSTSGYFLIEDVFYNDMRSRSAIDYSLPIMTWLRDSKEEALEKWELLTSGGMQKKQKAVLGSGPASKLPQFRTADMHKMRFCDLRFRVGAGYLYCHQGDCKHVIVIRDMRLVHPEDVQNRKAYPIITYQSKLRFQKCTICNITRAEKVTVDDKWAPENPCYFCLNCYYMLHYVDGKLLYDNFSVYDYFHD